ncbi:MAG: redox-regulated ATPase YchF [Candidatus Dojkabacteria bacterium]
MSLKIGLVGLPNAGKSTLFNSLTNLSVPAENYPFNTIEPNIGVSEVRDERLEELSRIVSPEKTTFAQVQYYDIAGLVKGASKGEGLGNQFLANIREVDGIVLVLRGFLDGNVEHVAGRLDPSSDAETLLTELRLKDLETVSKRLLILEKELKKNPEFSSSYVTYKTIESSLSSGVNVSTFIENKRGELEDNLLEDIYQLQLLTAKPIIYLLNSTDYSLSDTELQGKLGLSPADNVLAFDVKLESELLESGDFSDMDFGVDPGISRLTRLAFYALGKVVYFTAGKQEVRSWAIDKGANAREAAGKIHADFVKKFIAAEVASFQDFKKAGSWEALKENGKIKLEGKDYVVQDGDVILFKIGA